MLRFALFFVLSFFVGSCSLKLSSPPTTEISHLIDSRTVNRDDFTRATKYDWACLVIKGMGVKGSQWTEIIKDNPNTPTTLSVQFKMGNLLGGYSYTVTALAVDTNNAVIDSTVTQSPCPLDLPTSAGWAQIGKTTFKIPEQTKGTFKIDIPFDFYEPISLRSCVGSCYKDAVAQAEGKALGPDNVEMEYIFTSGSSGFKVWKEKGGQERILNATGTVANGWQMGLSAKGNGFSNIFFTDKAQIEGRVCPDNVFLDWNPKDKMLSTNRCLYYDRGNDKQRLDKESTPGQQPGATYLVAWNNEYSGRSTNSSYYEGNIKVCSDKMMRLPTMYETTMEKPPDDPPTLPVGDGLETPPVWAGGTKGVPPYDIDNYSVWTASANFVGGENTNFYWVWSVGNPTAYQYSERNGVRCVLPSH